MTILEERRTKERRLAHYAAQARVAALESALLRLCVALEENTDDAVIAYAQACVLLGRAPVITAHREAT